MTVKDLYELMEKKDCWSIIVYVDGYSDNILAYANSYYDVEGIRNNGEPYSLKELFEHKVVSFYAGYENIYVKIDTWEGMKLRERQRVDISK